MGRRGDLESVEELSGPQLVYIDESFDETVYRVGALLVPEIRRAQLDRDLASVALHAHQHYGVPEDAEFHGHSILQATEDWAVMKSIPRARIAVYRKALEAIEGSASAVVIRGVDRAGFRRRYAHRPEWNEHMNALMFTLEDLDRILMKSGSAAVAYADNCRFAASAVESFRTFQETGTWGYRSSQIRAISELAFVDSRGDRGIQAADLVNYLNHRASSSHSIDPRSRQATNRLMEIIEPIITVNRIWFP